MPQLEGNPLAELARRTRSGDPGAAEAFRREMSVALEGMVRLALRKSACFNPFEEHARAQADRLLELSDGRLPMAELVRQTANQVCQAMIGRLQAGGRLQDTITCGALGSGPGHRTVASGEWSGIRC